MILVVGATGLMGSGLCEALIARGERVKALVRTTSLQKKVDALRSLGVELCVGDLKDPQSIAAACRGVDAVISTASSTLSRQPGDSIESVDMNGQLSLVEKAKDAGVDRFIFVSFPRTPELSFPLADAKARVEAAIADLNFTVVQASWFMEVWLSPAFGFNYEKAEARVYGPGTKPISWVSFLDVANFCAVALRHQAAERKTLHFGGPEALSPLEVVTRFEKIGGKPFRLEQVPEQTIVAQFQSATDPMEKSFAALMVGYLHGNRMDMTEIVETFGIQLTGIDQYARRVLAKAATA